MEDATYFHMYTLRMIDAAPLSTPTRDEAEAGQRGEHLFLDKCFALLSKTIDEGDIRYGAILHGLVILKSMYRSCPPRLRDVHEKDDAARVGQREIDPLIRALVTETLPNTAEVECSDDEDFEDDDDDGTSESAAERHLDHTRHHCTITLNGLTWHSPFWNPKLRYQDFAHVTRILRDAYCDVNARDKGCMGTQERLKQVCYFHARSIDMLDWL